VFLAPAVLVYTAIMIVPLFGTLNLSLFNQTPERTSEFVGLANFQTLFGDPRWSRAFWNALGNNAWFFVVHMLVQNPIGILLAALLSSPRLRMAAFYRTAIFIPTILSFVIVGFVWKMILSPIWGIAPGMLDFVGLKSLFAPWLGKEQYALTALALVSVWQFVGIPMMLIYAALLSIPDEVLEAAEMDGITGMSQFWKIKLPLILPSIGIISILTFVGNFNAFDLIYVTQGALAGPVLLVTCPLTPAGALKGITAVRASSGGGSSGVPVAVRLRNGTGLSYSAAALLLAGGGWAQSRWALARARWRAMATLQAAAAAGSLACPPTPPSPPPLPAACPSRWAQTAGRSGGSRRCCAARGRWGRRWPSPAPLPLPCPPACGSTQ
jgi:raffinose/stachyose/melibiose transport system permease protein